MNEVNDLHRADRAGAHAGRSRVLQRALSDAILPFEQLGRAALNLLLEQIAARAPPDVVIDGTPELMVRSSTAPPSP